MEQTHESDQPQEPQRSLTDHFAGSNYREQPERWHSLWEDKWTPWDRGGPSLALADLLEGKAELFDLPGEGSEKTALVPGCGRGHDVLLLSAFGFDAYGLDVSTTAIGEARKNADSISAEGALKPRGQRAGSCHWVAGDFFGDDWVEEVGVKGGKFDLIFDYTFFCALPPSIRPAWAKRMAHLLAPGGRLICLEFPSSKSPSEPGPPWPSPPHTYVAYLGEPGGAPATEDHGNVLEENVAPPKKGGLHRLLHTKPERTHPAGMSADGQVDDHISVWSHVVSA